MKFRAVFSAALLCGVTFAATPTAMPPVSLAATPANDIAYLQSDKNSTTPLPFSEAVRVGRMLYLSGQIGTIPGTRTLVSGGMPAEAKQVMDGIKLTLERYGYSLNNVVKCTVMLADMSEWGAFNDIYKTYFTTHLPARSAIGANGLALGAKVEVECMAAK